MGAPKRGIALALVLILTSLIAIFAWGMLTSGGYTLTLAQSALRNDQAILAGEAGAWRTVGELTRDGSFPGYSTPQALSATGATYQTSVTAGPATAPNGQVVPAGLLYVLSVGRYHQEERAVGLMILLGDSPFSMAAFAAETIEVDGGSRIDTWNSTAGSYPAGQQGLKANVGSNLPVSQAILVEDGSSVDGTAYLAPGSPPDALTLDDGGVVNGGAQYMTQLQACDPVVLRADPSSAPGADFDGVATTLPPGTYGDVELDDGARLTLTGGQYVFNSIRVRRGSTIAVQDGSVADVQIANSLEMEDGSIVNLSGKPERLKIAVKSGTVELDDDAGSAYFVLYAPESDVRIDDNSHMFGSLVGRSIQVDDGSALSYDLSLQTLSGGSTSATLVSKQEF